MRPSCPIATVGLFSTHPGTDPATEEGRMRAIWKGAVSFGLVSVPVKLYSATESHDISFRQVHAKDGGRIKYKRVCSVDGEEVAYADIAKGFETDDGEMVILDDDDLAELPANSSREISVEKFVPSEQIDPLMLEKSYYLEPEKSGTKPYALLRDALRESDRVAIVTVSIRTRMTPAVLRVRDDVLVMQTMMWPDEVRNPDFGSLKDVSSPKPQELEMARLLLDTLAGDYDPEDFEDDYAEAVHALVQAKLQGGEVKRTKEAAPSAGEVVDLLAALQKSVAAAKTARGEEPEAAADDDEEADEAPRKKSTGQSNKESGKKESGKKASDKKASDKKTAAKKSTAKKAAPKKKAEPAKAKKSA
jgi:DNA end-binding protein Ku